MDCNTICEAMLYSYRHLEHRCKIVDNLILKLGLCSYNGDMLENFNLITKLMVEKKVYCNVKFIIDEAIKDMTDCEELKACFISGIDIEHIAEMYNITNEQLYHRFKIQTKKLCDIISSKYNNFQLINVIIDSKWLLSKYNNIIELKRHNRNYKLKIFSERSNYGKEI